VIKEGAVKDWFRWMLVMAGAVFAFAFWPMEPPVTQARDQGRSHSAGTAEHGERPAAASTRSPAATFGEYPCSSPDCDGHKAGFRWAQEHARTDPDGCTGSSGAFIEGCRVYAETHAGAGWIDPAPEGS
jgi:hypothetical protein